MTDLINHYFPCSAKCSDWCESSGLPGDTSAVSQKFYVWFTHALVQGSAPPHSSCCPSETLSPFSPSLWKCGNTGFSLTLIFGSNAHSSCSLLPLSCSPSPHHWYAKQGILWVGSFLCLVMISKQQQVFTGFYLWLVPSGCWSSALPSWCQEGLFQQEPCSGVGEQQGQQEEILVPGIAMKGTFNPVWGFMRLQECLPLSLLLAMRSFSSRIFQV